MIKIYKIQFPEDISLLTRLNSVVRDADALDRVRIDQNGIFNYKVNLNPNYLVNNTSKMLINAAYQLEFLTKRVPNINNIINFGRKEVTSSDRAYEASKDFDDRIRVDKVPTLDNSVIKDNSNEKHRDNSQRNIDEDGMR